MSELEEIIDASGELRRLGSLVPEQKNLLGAPAFSSKFPTWSDDDIRKAVRDPNRKPARVMFGDKWVHNQGSFGSCNGWATAGVYARARYRRGLMDGRQFSGSYVYSQIGGGRDQGSSLSDGMKQAQRGVCPIELNAFDKIYPNQITQAAHDAAKKFRALPETAFHIETMQELFTALAMGFACDAAVQAGRNFTKLNSKGVAGFDAGRGNHAIVLDDLILDGSEYLMDLCNSWSLSYGIRGRSYVTKEHIAQTIQVHDCFALVDVVEDGE